MERSEHGNRSDTNTDYLFQLLCFLKLHTYTRVQVSIDICGVDHPSRKRRFEVVYNLLSTRYNSRIRVQTSADEVTRISPVVSIFPSAGRWEREVWDMFGVSSINHPDLCRISQRRRGPIEETGGAGCSDSEVANRLLCSFSGEWLSSPKFLYSAIQIIFYIKFTSFFIQVR
ncbi:hypothetical protein ES319_A03G104600v1 [Gossypium barbadense]|uniref:NADH dehydrogenase [ubiquinone] iron-sulfur protein 3 n=1 Tax=Gossypium barbadense TaxID=3634 RepID=A0A5J5WBP6_GOSBA|nr:hypothetical protein ES319_A03G104600v1 [Gossypium barbadense]